MKTNHISVRVWRFPENYQLTFCRIYRQTLQRPTNKYCLRTICLLMMRRFPSDLPSVVQNNEVKVNNFSLDSTHVEFSRTEVVFIRLLNAVCLVVFDRRNCVFILPSNPFMYLSYVTVNLCTYVMLLVTYVVDLRSKTATARIR